MPVFPASLYPRLHCGPLTAHSSHLSTILLLPSDPLPAARSLCVQHTLKLFFPGCGCCGCEAGEGGKHIVSSFACTTPASLYMHTAHCISFPSYGATFLLVQFALFQVKAMYEEMDAKFNRSELPAHTSVTEDQHI